MTTSYDPFANRWKRQWPECVSQHDLVFLAPAEDPMRGIPLGNGDLGALCWVEDSRLLFAVNKNDLIDRDTGRAPGDWSDRREETSCFRHGCRLVVDFHMPLFEAIYLETFEARLRLADATAHIQTKTPFASADISAFVESEGRVLAVDCRLAPEAGTELEVRLERWGSRVFKYWGGDVDCVLDAGLDGTAARGRGRTLLLRQRLRTMEFVVGLRIQAEPEVRSGVRNPHEAYAALPAGRTRLYLTVVTSEEAADPEREALRLLDRAGEEGTERLHERHCAAWKDFWGRSFLALPPEQNFLENLWYLQLYYGNSSSRGKVPAHFTQGLWGHYHDFTPWRDIFHWNMQGQVRPFQAAGHSELARPYYEFRRRTLPQAREFAREVLHRGGAFYADVVDWAGNGDRSTRQNNTPGAAIALDFWRQYRYTLDGEFLREAVWPVLYEVAEYYRGFLRKAADGRWHIRATTAYEGVWPFDDTVTDIAAVKALFPAARRAAALVGYGDETTLAAWADIEQNIVDYTLVELEPGETELRDGRRVWTGIGMAAGEECAFPKAIAAGFSDEPSLPRCTAEPRAVRSRKSDSNSAYYGIPDPELSGVYPFGGIGLREAGTPLFEAARNQLRMHPHPESPPSLAAGLTGDYDDCCMGWCPYAIMLARLGMAEEAGRAVSAMASYYLNGPQGFGHEFKASAFLAEDNLRWKTHSIADTTGRTTDKRSLLPDWHFRHFDGEPLALICGALDEMLLQSHEDRIRLCPALPAGWDVSFQLAAEGGFLVRAEHRDGGLQWACVESLHGAECVLAEPWDGETSLFVLAPDGAGCAPSEFCREDGCLRFATEPGRRYLLLPAGADPADWEVREAPFARNAAPKRFGNACLGLDPLNYSDPPGGAE